MAYYPVTARGGRPGEPLEKPQPLRGEIVLDEPAPHGTATLLDLISFIMDRLLPIPGTRLRVGLNSLVLLLPFVGDALASLVSVGILVVGLSSYRVPRIVAVRMMLNTLLDTSLGWIPVIGDLFDLFFKADTRNVRLLQEYLSRGEEPPPPTWRHWLFVIGLLGAFGLIMALIVIGAVVLVRYLISGIIAR